MTHHRNLCATVENRPRYETLKCTVVRVKAYAPSFVWNPHDPDYMNPELMNTAYHEWPDHKGGISGCPCIHCGKTLKEVRVRINPKTGQPVRRSTLAREIALTPADVPPVRFVGRF